MIKAKDLKLENIPSEIDFAISVAIGSIFQTIKADKCEHSITYAKSFIESDIDKFVWDEDKDKVIKKVIKEFKKAGYDVTDIDGDLIIKW